MFSVLSVIHVSVMSAHVSIYSVNPFTLETLEPFHIGWYEGISVIISRLYLSIKVIGSRSCANNDNLLVSTCYSFVCSYRSLIRSRSHIKGQIKVTSKESHSYMGGLHLKQMRSCIL